VESYYGLLGIDCNLETAEMGVPDMIVCVTKYGFIGGVLATFSDGFLCFLRGGLICFLRIRRILFRVFF
jgi:hypothetical protein